MVSGDQKERNEYRNGSMVWREREKHLQRENKKKFWNMSSQKKKISVE
jgi:hypothetical protein